MWPQQKLHMCQNFTKLKCNLLSLRPQWIQMIHISLWHVFKIYISMVDLDCRHFDIYSLFLSVKSASILGWNGQIAHVLILVSGSKQCSFHSSPVSNELKVFLENYVVYSVEWTQSAWAWFYTVIHYSDTLYWNTHCLLLHVRVA